jgi:hypothetical protein
MRHFVPAYGAVDHADATYMILYVSTPSRDGMPPCWSVTSHESQARDSLSRNLSPFGLPNDPIVTSLARCPGLLVGLRPHSRRLDHGEEEKTSESDWKSRCRPVAGTVH